MTQLPTLILALAGALAAQTAAPDDQAAAAPEPAAPSATSEAAPGATDDATLDEQLAELDAELALPYGDLVISEEEARLDLRAEPRLVWALIGEELADARLDAVVVEAPVDRWQLLDELWLRVESLPYMGEGWTRVRVRAGSFESDADRLRAEDLLSALALRLLDLEALKQAPAAPLAPAANPAPAASAGGGAFAQAAPATTYVPIWVPAWGLGSVSCATPLVFADTYAWAYGGYGNYWPSYASACNSFGFGWGYTYGGLGHYKHYGFGYGYGGSYALGFHHGYHLGFYHGTGWYPWYDDWYDHHHDDDHTEWDGWENGGDAGEGGLTPDAVAQLRERKQLAAAADDDALRRRLDNANADDGDARRERGARTEPEPLVRGDRGDRGERTALREKTGVVPVVRREVERRSPTRVASVMPESAVPARAPMVVRRTSERTGRPPALRSSSVVERVVRRSAPAPAAPLVVGRPSLLPPSYGGSARTISASGVTRAGSPVSSAAPARPSSSSTVTRTPAVTVITPRPSSSSRAADIVSRATAATSSRGRAPVSVPTPAPSPSPRTTSPRTSSSRLFGGSSLGASSRSSSRATSSRSSASRSSGSSRSSSRASSSSRGSSSSSRGRSSRGGRGRNR